MVVIFSLLGTLIPRPTENIMKKSHKQAPKTRTYRQTRVKGNTEEPSFVEIARRKQILEAALTLFAQKGFQKTSLSDIAAAIKVSKGVISYHFDGKEDLGEQVLRHGLQNYSKFVKEQLAHYKTSTEKLLRFPGACFAYVREHQLDYLIYTDTQGSFTSPQDRRRFIAEQDRGLRRLLIGMIEEGKAEGGIRNVDPGPVADILQATVDGLSGMECADPGAANLEACERVFRNMLQHYLTSE